MSRPLAALASMVLAVLGALTLFGCGQQEVTKSGEGEQGTTAEQTTRFYRVPDEFIEGYRGVLECRDKGTEAAILDPSMPVRGAKKASLVEQARRDFPKRIEEGDKVEAAEGQGDPEVVIVRVVRDERVVALLSYSDYNGAGGRGWLLGSYEACGEFTPPPTAGTDGQDLLLGTKGEDELRGFGATDEVFGDSGSDVLYGETDGDLLYGGQDDDVLYGGDGDDFLAGGDGADVIYGGDGNDHLIPSEDGERDKLYCGAGKDKCVADKLNYVSSSCEVKTADVHPWPDDL